MDLLTRSRALRITFAASSGALYAASVPGYDLAPFAFVALVPLLVATHEVRWAESALLYFVTGLVVSLLCSVWVFGPATLYSGSVASTSALIYAGLSLAHGGWFSCVSVISSLVLRRSDGLPSVRARAFARFITITAAWVVVESLHEQVFSSIPWTHIFLSTTQWRNEPMLPWASLGGAPLISALVMSVNVLTAYGVTRSTQERYTWTLLAKRLVPAAAVAGVVHVAGLALAPGESSGMRRTLSVAILQENIGAPDRWDDAFVDSLAHTMLRLNADAVRHAPDLIVWSETAIPWTFEEDDDLLAEVLRMTRSAGPEHLVGMLTPIGHSGNVFNSMFLIQPDGAVTGRYDKRQLLAFLERPLFGEGGTKNTVQFSFAQSRYDNIVPGERNAVIKTRFGNAGVLICNEALTPWAARAGVLGGAAYLVVSSNDAWFAGTALTRMHLAKTVLRAVETRRDVVFNANGGYAGVIRMDGSIEATLSNGTSRVVPVGVHLRSGLTPAVTSPLSVLIAALASLVLNAFSHIIPRRFA